MYEAHVVYATISFLLNLFHWGSVYQDSILFLPPFDHSVLAVSIGYSNYCKVIVIIVIIDYINLEIRVIVVVSGCKGRLNRPQFDRTVVPVQ